MTFRVLLPPLGASEDRVGGERTTLARREHEGVLLILGARLGVVECLQLLEQLGNRRVDLAVRSDHTVPAVLVLIDGEDDAGRVFEDGVEELFGRDEARPVEACSRERLRILGGELMAEAPDDRRRVHAFRQARPERAVENDGR